MKITIIALATCLVSLPVLANTIYLSKDLGTRGQQHLCRYSDGKVYSFNQFELCPLQLHLQGYVVQGSLGILEGQYKDGFSKVCVYSIFGKKRAIRIGEFDACPFNYTF